MNADANEARLLETAGRVADGLAVDWDAAENESTSGEDRQVFRHLRLLESVAQVHREGERAATLTAASGVGLARQALANGARWGQLAIRKRLGSGGFGDVYLAWDEVLEREVALKILHRPSAGSDGDAGADDMVREARLLARVRHPNVVTVYGAEATDGRVGLWMEHIAGETLDDLVTLRGPYGAREAAGIGVDLCRALAAVHGAGLVHRDIKAGNVMREEGGRIVLMDFGVGADRRQLAQTASWRISGTPRYMAPEVLAGGPPTRSSDVYSLGVLLYYLVTGSYPVDGGSMTDLIARHEAGERRLLRDVRADLPAAFVQAVELAIDPEPARRFASAGELEQALAAVAGWSASGLSPGREPARGWRALLPGVGVGAAAVALGLVTWLGVPELPGGAAPYSVKAAFVRIDEQGARVPVASGDPVAVGDRLAFELEASEDLWVYVFNEDLQGGVWALFPLPGLDLANPLPAGRRHELPGSLDGEAFSWLVDSDGGRERLVVMASRERLEEFEAELARAPQPERTDAGFAVAPPPGSSFRGVGGLAPMPRIGGGTALPRLWETAQRIATAEEHVDGAWLRRIELVHARAADAGGPVDDP